MVVELLVGAGLVMAGAAAARVLLRRRELLEDEAEGDEEAEGSADGDGEKANAASKSKKTKKKERRRSPLDRGPRGLRVGDVLLYADTELWLAGLIQLDEEGFVLRVFPSPGGTRAEWVAQLDEPAKDLATLEACDEVPGGAVPEALPIGGRHLTLERRGHADVFTDGEHLPRTTDRARYTLLSDAGGRILIVVDFDKAPRLALVGDRVGAHMIDLLPGGDLED
ncbi:MAG TPA: hypothetical protein RMH99_12865 [Sandaracinaceae bacterium LLY-WYZ-13_1]|nr:hypothetical protein [Sandaracinaceae bacterium LLY-WYZ-13_1]